MTMYHEHVLDHYKHPRKKGSLESPTVALTDSNPLCGDEITVYFDINGDRIAKARQFTQGCAVSQAAASMFFEQLEGMSVDEVLAFPKEDLLAEFGADLSVSRIKCALLALTTTKKALLTQSTTLQHAGAKPAVQQEQNEEEHA
jgi:nitrogen fixation protein NifU and related proteins